MSKITIKRREKEQRPAYCEIFGSPFEGHYDHDKDEDGEDDDELK